MNIDIFYDENGKLSRLRNKIFKNLNDDDKKFIMDSFIEYDNLKDKLLSLKHGDYKVCPICNTIISWDKNVCKLNSCIQDFKRIKCIEKYGVDNPAKVKEIRDKAKQTMVEKYGVPYAMQSDELKNKHADNLEEKYGYRHNFKIPSVQEKRKSTMVERYGVEYSYQNPELYQKYKNTIFKKYGVENLFRLNEFREYSRMKMKEIYGVEYMAQSPLLLDKVKNTNIENKINYIKNKINITLTYQQAEKIQIDVSRDYSSEYLKQVCMWIINENQPEFSIIQNEYSNNHTIVKAKYFGYDTSFRSSGELLICDFLTGLDIEYVCNKKNIISPYEIDIYIPSHKLAIEFNGSYWHSNAHITDKNYHQNKTKLCNEKGITLIHIYEHIFKEKKDIYFDIIKSKLNLNEKIYGRKCKVKEINKKTSSHFFEKYHLNGNSNASVNLGLYDSNNMLLSVMSFGKSRYDKKYSYELIRYSIVPGYSVIGGFSKLLKYFKMNYYNGDILCYNDASISYKKSDIITSPNYWWWHPNTGIFYNRYKTMKSNLKNILYDKFDSNMTEFENMINSGFLIIYDAGNYKSIL